MKRLLVGDCKSEHLFELSDPDAPSEVEYESDVAKALMCLCGGYKCIVFGGKFRLDDKYYCPDLALVAQDHSHWFVIEVEMASHSLVGHVLPQVRAFRYGSPSNDCDEILSRELHIDVGMARTLVQHVPRSVVVVANKYKSDWRAALQGAEVQYVVLSKFVAKDGTTAYQMDGTIEVLRQSLGFGQYVAVDKSVRFSASTDVPVPRVQINDPLGVCSWWEVSKAGSACWMRKEIGTPSIPDGAILQLIRTVEGHLSFRYPS